MDRDRLAVRLELGDYEFLRHIDPQSLEPREVLRLGEDAAHQVGVILLDLNLPRFAERLFRLSWEEGVEPWAYESLLALLQLLDSQERFPEIESLARAGRDRYGEDQALLRHLLGALYRQERDAGLLDLIDDLHERDAEWALWRAVSASRVGETGWTERYRELYRDYPATAAHSRVWVYLLANPGIAASFTPEELAFFSARHLLQERRHLESMEAFLALADQLLREPPDALPGWSGLLLSPSGLLDFYRAGSVSGRQSVTAGALEKLAALAVPPLQSLALEYAGRLYRTAGAYAAAIPLLERSLELRTGADAERVRWYLLSAHVRGNPEKAATVLSRMAPLLGDPGYYSDVLSELCGLLAGMGRWDALLQAYGAIRDVATAGTLAGYELVLADAVRAGVLPVAPDRRESLRRTFLERAAGQTGDLFAALVASSILGRSGDEVILAAAAAEREEPERPGADQLSPESDGGAGILIRSAMRYGLLTQAYDQVTRPRASTASSERLRDEILAELADRLSSAGRVRESIQVALRMKPGPAGDAAALSDPLVAPAFSMEQVLSRRFPNAYASLMEEVLADEPVDQWVMYALVREESLFDPRIVSVAGAVGLTQLLPSTASDVARRMRVEVTDLTDPAQNLTVGTRYLAMLQDQFGSVMKALAAYNAGQGRVRSWERQWPGLDSLLFHRAIPFAETYQHVRKVVVSAAYYGYLYGDRAPSRTVQTVFGDLETVQ